MTRLKADISLILVTLGWGISYLLTDICLGEMEPLTLNALRFSGAFVIAFLMAPKKLAGISGTTIRFSALIGAALFVVYIGATYGIMYTSLSNAGFLCGLTVVITPVLGFFLFHKKPEKKIITVLFMALVGIALLTMGENMRPALGDILCIMCAFAYAVDLLITEKAVNKQDVNAYQLGVCQLGFTGIFMTVSAFIFEEPHLPAAQGVWASLLFLTVFCTGVAFIVQAVAQQYTDASRVGIIFALEPVFAGIVAFVFAGEVLRGKAYIGAVLLILGILYMETDVKSLLGRKRPHH
ncbi:MAG: DMT family transporter [Clostridiales Family XIII bacterium]|jgi:drug/metabolite transporter (DMT)-like permease|nr:DMT family transporter [Clostridiales Family XIII bacterium]